MKKRLACLAVLTMFTVPFLLSAGCSSTTSSLMQIPFLDATVTVTDENNQPISNAIVDVEGSGQTSTGPDGNASLKFGSLGVHRVKVMADGRMPSAFTVTMPLDRGKNFPTRLAKPVDININANVGGNLFSGQSGSLLGAQLYPFMFQTLFVAYGYDMDMAPYDQGQWTEWQVSAHGDDSGMKIRKALLKRLDNGQEWWQMKLPGKAEDEGMIMEVLFSRDRESLRRMRQKTGKGQPQEVPVAEGWYTKPISLTPESMEGAVKTTGATVKVSAGTFTADVLEFAGMGGGGTLRFWRTRQVPGALVKAETVDQNGKTLWSSQLEGYGKDAVTELGSY